MRASWLDAIPEQGQLTANFATMALDALLALGNKHAADLVGEERTRAQALWFEMFRFYGTHYVQQVDLGGKMIYSKMIAMKAVTQARAEGEDVTHSAGHSISAEQESKGGFMGFGGGSSESSQSSSSQSFSVSKNELSTFQQAVADSSSSTIVMGGTPPGKGAMTVGGFAEWAESVTHKPIPIKYRLFPIAELGEVVAQSRKPPPPPPPPPSPPPVPQPPFPPMLPITEPTAATTKSSSSKHHGVMEQRSRGTELEDPDQEGPHFETTFPGALQSPPPPPNAPQTFSFQKRCKQGVAISKEEVFVGFVHVDDSNLYPALEQCWSMVYHKFPSPRNAFKYADGLMLGLRGDEAKGACYAEFGLTAKRLYWQQEGDWVTCRPTLSMDEAVIPEFFSLPTPPPPPPPPSPLPPSPPPPPVTEAGARFMDAYWFYVGRFALSSKQAPYLDGESNILEMGGGACASEGSVQAASSAYHIPLSTRIQEMSQDEQQNYCYTQCFDNSAAHRSMCKVASECTGDAVALEFRPNAPAATRCQCFYQCPKIGYISESLDMDAKPPSHDFMLQLFVNCEAKDKEGAIELRKADFHCNPASYQPWPQRFLWPPPPFPPGRAPRPPPPPSPPPPRHSHRPHTHWPHSHNPHSHHVHKPHSHRPHSHRPHSHWPHSHNPHSHHTHGWSRRRKNIFGNKASKALLASLASLASEQEPPRHIDDIDGMADDDEILDDEDQ